ncbi:MAG: hypothetical protein IJU49_06470 [Lachnospiraceae bacterium]|nr:hypothetical protein [Lachnospiraceae bacterium]
MFGYAWKSILRTPVKTILFIVLVAAITVFSCLGFGMWNASNELLERADGTYKTSALVEYVDDGYPASTDYTETMLRTLKTFDYSILSDQEEVVRFDRQYDIGGHVEGFRMDQRTGAFSTMNVLLLRYFFTTSRGDIFSISEIPYLGAEGRFWSIKSGMQVTLTFEEGLEHLGENGYEKGHYYLAVGQFYMNKDNTYGYRIVPTRNDAAPEEAKDLLKEPFLDVGENRKDRDAWPEEAEYLLSQARFFQLSNSHITVHPTTDVSLATPFLQQETHLLEGGRYFTEEEYKTGAHKIIVSERFALSLEKEIGDTIPLDLYSAFTPSEDGLSGTSDFWPSKQTFLEQGDYEIIGVFQNTDTLLKTVYIPLSEDNTWLADLTAGYQMAVIQLKNGTGDSYYAKVKPLLSANMRFTIYDQGYSEAVAPVLSMQRTAVLISLISLASSLAVLLLFAYMYVSRQKGTADTMTALGTGRSNTTAYLLFCVLLVAFISVLIGVLIGYFLSERVNQAAYERALQTTSVDHRFSAVYTNVETISLVTDFKPELRPLLLVGASVLGISILYALLLTIGVFRKKNGERIRKARDAKKSAGNPGKKLQSGKEPKSRITSTSPTLVSILRGGAKNLIVPLVSLVLVAFIGIFSGEIIRSESQINDLYDHSTVMGYYTTVSGWRIENLLLDRDAVEPVITDSFIEKVYRSSMVKSEGMSVSDPSETASDTEAPGDIVPDGPFSGIDISTGSDDALISVHADGPIPIETGTQGRSLNSGQTKVVFTEDLRYSPEFFFGEEPIVNWLPGYDESIFQGEEELCIVSSQFAKKHGLEPGDVLSASFIVDVMGMRLSYTASARIVGIFNGVSAEEHVYMPFSMSEFTVQYVEWTRTGVPIYQDEDVVLPYSSLSFKLQNLRNLSEFKEDLAKRGYTSVGKYDRARKFVVIEDTLLNSSVASLERHIAYMKILFAVTYLLAAVIGFVISYLMTKSRRKELAMMRSMGAGRVRTFFAFFAEQLVLALIGSAAGILVITLAFGSLSSAQWLYFLGYFACYLLGIALSITVMNRVNVMDILTKED